MRRARAELDAALVADAAGEPLAAAARYAEAVKSFRHARDEVQAGAAGAAEHSRIDRLVQQCAPEVPAETCARSPDALCACSMHPVGILQTMSVP
jgi:hypothetical protein